MQQAFPTRMFGVSTEQNTTNVLPALQLGVKSFCFLESETAHQNKWSSGAVNVFNQRKIQMIPPLVFENTIGTNVAELSTLLNEKAGIEPVIWNLGGGLKPHQLSIWNTMRNRQEQGIPDIACYASPETRNIQLIQLVQGELKQSALPISTDIRVEELLGIFGYDVFGSEHREIYPTANSSNHEPFNDYFQEKWFREYLFRLAGLKSIDIENRTNELQNMNADELRNIFEQRTQDFNSYFLDKINDWSNWLDNQNLKNRIFNTAGLQKLAFENLASKLRKSLFQFLAELNQTSFEMKDMDNLSPELKGLLSKNDLIALDNELLKMETGFETFPKYFEKLVSVRMQKMLQQNEHHYKDAYSNLKIALTGAQKETAEYDVLCITQTGVFHAYDAKTFTFGTKDNDARLMNLVRASGRFVKFAAVIPYDPEDVNEDWFPQAMRDEVWKFEQRGTPFFVIADSRDEDFYVTRDKENGEENSIVKISDRPPGIRCRLLKNAFN